MSMTTIEKGIEITKMQLAEFNLEAEVTGTSELSVQRSDGSTCKLAVRTSSTENNMKFGNDADFYIYIQRSKSNSPTIRVFTASEVNAMRTGDTLAKAATAALNAWGKLLRNVRP